MFDDYDFKSKEIYEFRFKQKREGSTLPWEMASFINDINTIYYKQDLLNSISTALLKNISSKDIFIFDGTLSFSKKFNNLDLFNESDLANLFYEVGHPYAITPNIKTYKIKFLFEIFNKINSLLKQHRFQCLRVKTLTEIISSLDDSEYIENQIKSIIDIASEKTIYLCQKNQSILNRRPIDPDEFYIKIKKTIEKHKLTIPLIQKIENFSDQELISIMSSRSKADTDLKKELNRFYTTFNNVIRPVVCVRVGEGKIRILARSFFNKNSFGALDLRKAYKNSPPIYDFWGIPGAITGLVKGFIDIDHTLLKNKIEIENLNIEKEKKLNELETSKNQRIISEIELKRAKENLRKKANEWVEIKTHSGSYSDAHSFSLLDESAAQKSLSIAYNNISQKAIKTYKEHETEYVENSLKRVSKKDVD